MTELKPCPKCKDSWLYASNGDYYSGYESFGYRVKCSCGYAWKIVGWHPTEKEAIDSWNRRVNNEPDDT